MEPQPAIPRALSGRSNVLDDGRTITTYIDLGGGGLDALAKILKAVSAAPAGADVGRCRVR